MPMAVDHLCQRGATLRLIQRPKGSSVLCSRGGREPSFCNIPVDQPRSRFGSHRSMNRLYRIDTPSRQARLPSATDSTKSTVGSVLRIFRSTAILNDRYNMIS